MGERENPSNTNTFRVGGTSTWVGVLALIATLGLVELAAVGFIGHRFLPSWLAWAVDAVSIAAYAGALLAVGSVLWRGHVVTDESALFVLGYLGTVSVPRDVIGDVRSLPALPETSSDRTGPLLEDGRLAIVAATGIPRLELRLTRPVRARRLWQRREVTAVELGVIDDGLASALAGCRD